MEDMKENAVTVTVRLDKFVLEDNQEFDTQEEESRRKTRTTQVVQKKNVPTC